MSKIMAKKKFLVDRTKGVAAKLVSATVENAQPTRVVLTMIPGAEKMFADAVAGEFALTGKTISGITLSYVTHTLTVTVTVGYAAGAGFNLTWNPTQKGDTVVVAVTNNVS